MDTTPQPRRGLRAELRTLPNLFTALRLLLLPGLWALALMKLRVQLGVALALVAATDFVDGLLARRLHAATALGSRFDSIADHLLSASTVAWLILLRGDFFRPHRTLLFLWMALALATLAVGLIRFHRPVDLHLYSAKVATTVAYLFAVYLLLFEQPHHAAFYLTIAVLLVAAAEALLVQLTRTAVDEHIGSIVSRLARRRRGP